MVVRGQAVKKRSKNKNALYVTGIIVRVLAVITTTAAIVFLSVMVLPRLAGIYPYVILSGSMEPTIPAGAVAFVDKKAAFAGEEDIIAFFHPNDPEVVVVHRVIEVTGEGYITQGDANEAPDGDVIPREKLIGICRYSIPYLGFFVSEITLTRTELAIAFLLAVNIAAELLHKVTKPKRRKINR